jgi:hypothetical protein
MPARSASIHRRTCGRPAAALDVSAMFPSAGLAGGAAGCIGRDNPGF